MKNMLKRVLVFAITIGLLSGILSPCFLLKASAADNTTSAQYINEDSTFVLASQSAELSYDSPIAVSDNYHEDYNIQNDKASDTQMILESSGTVGDPMVYYTQKWLNQEYGNVPGFGTIIEDGKTGWGTIYGLLRALQYELGIKDLANSFGPTTSSLYEQNVLKKQIGVTNRKFAILQGALWCKGYNPGYNLYESNGVVVFNAVFDDAVEQAVINLKRDAYGSQDQDGIVTLNVMKALMSMDSFKLLYLYGGRAEVRSMQQSINRKYEAYTGLNPCDGVYGRNTNKALVYALQAEEGLPVGIANGSFGPTTQLHCPQIPYVQDSNAAKSYSGAYYTSNQISSFTELMQFALYVNGFGNGNFSGIFSSRTTDDLLEFQMHHALIGTGIESGIADKGTWMSLLLSSGDPNRSALGADCAMILNKARAETLYSHGYRIVGRYLTGTYGGGISKAITKEEAQIVFDAGLRFFPIYQTSSNNATYFTEERGVADAEAAIEAALALGLPANTIIYFAVDFDAMDNHISANVIPYFKKVHERMSKGIYRTGVYGTRNVCSRVAELGYSCSSFVGDMSTGFSGNLGFTLPDDWAFDQFANLEGTKALGQGDGRIEIDKNAVSGRDQGVSQLEQGFFKYSGQFINTHDSVATYFYKDEYFLTDAAMYNPQLSTMSLCFELSSWSSYDVELWTHKSKNARSLLTGEVLTNAGIYEKKSVGIGFKQFLQNDAWDSIPTRDSIGLVAANKNIIDANDNDKEYTLIALAVRGGGYGSEWASNFKIGESGSHAGFTSARDDTLSFLKQYIYKYSIRGDIKLWIVGYSRAGAVANMVGGKLNDGYSLPNGNRQMPQHLDGQLCTVLG